MPRCGVAIGADRSGEHVPRNRPKFEPESWLGPIRRAAASSPHGQSQAHCRFPKRPRRPACGSPIQAAIEVAGRTTPLTIACVAKRWPGAGAGWPLLRRQSSGATPRRAEHKSARLVAGTAGPSELCALPLAVGRTGNVRGSQRLDGRACASVRSCRSRSNIFIANARLANGAARASRGLRVGRLGWTIFGENDYKRARPEARGLNPLVRRQPR